MTNHARVAVLAGLSAGSASLSALPPRTRFILRGRPADLAAAVPVPDVCRSVSAGDCTVLWLGPDEFLLFGADAARLHAALAAVPHALVDVSHRQVGITVAGPGAADVLACGCPLDLDLSAFPVGTCTRTVLAKSEIVLWRTGPAAFHLEVFRSFAAYAWQLLEQARRDWTT